MEKQENITVITGNEGPFIFARRTFGKVEPVTQSPSSEILLWCVSWGTISAKPKKCLDLGNGEIRVVGSCLIRQKRDDQNESYHDTYHQAMIRFVADAQRDVNNAKKQLANAKRRLKNAKTKWNSYVANPNHNA